MAKTYVRKGVRYARMRTYPSRYSEGKVHLTIYRRDRKSWVTACRFDDVDFGYHGEDVESGTLVTCRSCVKRMPD